MTENQATQNKAKKILAACALFNLSIGILFAWSALQLRLTMPIDDGGFGWSSSQAGFPYVIAIVFFSLGVVIGGRIQDKIGPRWVMTTGGTLMGLGLILSGFAGNNVAGVVLCFGIIAGVGMGFGYGCAAPPALKWFPPTKKGMISGIIVGSFGLSAMIYAPLINLLLSLFGIEWTLIVLGTGALIASVSIAQFISNPPSGYVPAASETTTQQAAKSTPATDFTWREMLETRRFRLMFIMFILASSVGLMVIGNMTRIAQTQVGSESPWILVSFLAITNTVGRIVGGKISDKVGRINALYMALILQMLNMAAFPFYSTMPALLVGIVLVGFCYGTLLSVMPALCADQYGLKNFGVNYGILFLAWGASGLVAPMLAGFFFDATGSFTVTYIICAVMTIGMIYVNFLLKKDIDSRMA